MKKKLPDNSVELLYILETEQLPKGGSFDNHAAAQLWVNQITASAYWCKHAFLPKYIRVLSHGDLNYSENKSPNEVWLANQHLNPAVVLHELAHFFPPFDGHGPQFIRAYINLLAQFLGLHYSNIYSDVFTANQIQF